MRRVLNLAALLSSFLSLIPFAVYAQTAIYTCKTEKHMVIIDQSSPKSPYRYRSWNAPKKTDVKPDMEVATGTMEIQGRGSCGYTEYSFKKGKVEFVVENGVGCVEQEPKGATGHLRVKIGDEEKSHYWCFPPTAEMQTTVAPAQNSQEVGPSCPDISVTSIKSKEALFKLLGALKSAALAKDADAMGQLVIYPLRINAPPGYMVKNAADLKHKFSSIFDDRVLKAIATQKPEEIFCRNQGAMIGNGEAWIDQKGGKTGIYVIN